MSQASNPSLPSVEPADALSNPILNSPYEPPKAHFVLGPNGPTGEVKTGRRPSESFIPVPMSRKKRGRRRIDPAELAQQQEMLDLFDTTGERRERNQLINDIRYRVELWRVRGYTWVTPISRKLLNHWADETREDRILFCQREAVETAIYLAEVAGRHGEPDFRALIGPENDEHNNGLPRVALKMATGTGKTVVMCMIIVWQTTNKAFSPRDRRFTNRFLVLTPGITIRDRLRVLLPHDETNYYDLRGLVPHDLRTVLDDAAIIITNYHTFLPKTAKEMQGIAKNTRLLLTSGKETNPFLETDEDVADRVMRDLSSRGKGEVLVLNDEAHHCYQDKPLGSDEPGKEAKERNESARVWFRGLEAVSRRVGVKIIYDLSATPYYLGGSGYQEGYIFPWVVSDFSLMDAIESGIVKVPRVPVDDDVVSTEQPTYLWLWDHIGDKLPKRVSRNAESDSSWIPPVELQGALESLHRSYEKRFQVWKRDLEPHGEPPPVMIVICPNTVVSKLVFDWIAGQEVELPDGSKGIRKGNLDLLTNVANGTWLDRPPTIIVDSAQLESGESLKSNFKQAVSQEIETFKREYSRRNPGADLEKLTDEDLLREVMNTVGKKGKLGETVRCVVSVSMLTEGWDANTVTHILGIRRFGSQLLCEQVVGRGLRRRSYEANAEGKFEPEYADVYGVPFVFIPTDRTVSGSKPAPPAIEVRALPERQNLRIVFPKLDGYRVEVPEEPIEFDHEHTRPLHIDRDSLALWVESAGMIGATEEVDLSQVRNTRSQHIVYAVAAEVLQRFFSGHDGALKPWLFPAIVDVTRRWFEHKVTFAADTPPGVLLLAQYKATAAEAVYNAIVRYPDARQEIILPMFRRFDNRGSTDNVSFLTRKVVVGTERSPVNYVVLDGLRGNTWEETVTDILEGDTERVSSYVKNDHLDFDIPYVHEGRSHRYLPDFLVRLVQPEDDPFTRTLIIEVSGGRKSPGATAAKAKTARDHWCTAVNNHGEWGKWGYVEIDSMTNASERIGSAIDALYADAPIIGEPIR